MIASTQAPQAILPCIYSLDTRDSIQVCGQLHPTPSRGHTYLQIMLTQRQRNKLCAKQNIFIAVSIIGVFFLALELSQSIILLKDTTKKRFKRQEVKLNPFMAKPQEAKGCPDVTSGMMRGKWEARPMSLQEVEDIKMFLHSVRSGHGLPMSDQREDQKCGNLTLAGADWFRGLCEPKGPTPCCYKGHCEPMSQAECQCPDCLDLRPTVHAEYSTWRPENPQCHVKNFTLNESCSLLRGTEIHVVGDSFLRHFYTALLLLLSGNPHDGAIVPTVSKEVHDNCTGMYTFTEKMCRIHIKPNAQLCNNTVTLGYKTCMFVTDKDKFHSLVRKLAGKANTFVLVGIGIHDRYSYNVLNTFMLPAIEILRSKNTNWPRLIWATSHNFHIMKTPLVPGSNYEYVRYFNTFMTDNLREYDVPIFDTFNMTSGVVSPDGAHYGMGINMMKAQMFLNFIQELNSK